MADFHLVESAEALHYGLEVEDEDDGEIRRGDCLLIRLGTNEVGMAEDLPLPEDAPERPGELLLLVRPDVAMDLGDAIRGALQAYLNATVENAQRLVSPEMSRGSIVERGRARVGMTDREICRAWAVVCRLTSDSDNMLRD